MGRCAECEQTLNENEIRKERQTSVRGRTVAYVDFYYFECPHCGERYYTNGSKFSFVGGDSE